MRITKSSHKALVAIAQHAYPEYKGRRFFVEYQNEIDISENANWDGGTKTHYKFVRLDNGAILSPPDFAPWKRPDNEKTTILSGCACVTHLYFCGHDCGLTVHLSDKTCIERRVKLASEKKYNRLWRQTIWRNMDNNPQNEPPDDSIDNTGAIPTLEPPEVNE